MYVYARAQLCVCVCVCGYVRSTNPLHELMANLPAVMPARIEILIATLMFHSAARPFASITDVHSICMHF